VIEQLVASTANSIGSSLNTSLQNPLTTIEMACSAEPARLAIEQLVFADLRRRRFVLDGACLLRTSMYGKVCAPQALPISIESHCV
jgi:hypothetical protein